MFFDHGPEGLEQAIDIEVEAVRELGMRATLCRGSINVAGRTTAPACRAPR